MFRWSVVLFLSVALFTTAFPAWAADQNSANFQNNSASFSPTTFDRTSPNFQLNASVDSIVGAAESANFQTMQGVPLREPIPTVTPPGTGSGGLGAVPTNVVLPLPGTSPQSTRQVPPPTLEYRRYTFASAQRIGGDRDSTVVYALVNGSPEGLMYPTLWKWAMDFPLTLGRNLVTVQGVAADGAKSQMIGGEIERLLIGDVNVDHVVNDIDLSKFTRATKKYTFFSDFNEDREVNTLDLSLIASHWLMSF